MQNAENTGGFLCRENKKALMGSFRFCVIAYVFFCVLLVDLETG